MKKNNRQLCFYSFTVTLLTLLLLFWHYGYAPFGDNSLASHDAGIQYLNFYSYFKDVLSGKNSLTYTFSKTLGGNCIGVFSYYLTSPFMLLSVFFKKSQLHSFFDLLVILKLSLASFTFCWFLIGRFRKYLADRSDLVKNSCIVILSVSYGLCQYNIAQSSNLMWLDGVYMLPLILLGVYRLLYSGSVWKLTVPVALSILFNWYIGGINCLFSGIWLLLELCIYLISSDFSKKAISHCLRSIARYLTAMISGVLCSCVLFLPTVSAMRNSNRGALDFSTLLNFNFTGNFSTVLSNYVFGSVSKEGSVSLFCGTFAITGLIALFLSGKVSARLKTVLGSFAVLFVMILYWEPFCTVFSLFKAVSSFWYRYSYLTIFGILFIAAFFYLAFLDKESPFVLIRSSVIFAGLLLLLRHNAKGDNALQQTCTTVLIAFFTAAAFSIFTAFTRQQLNLYRWTAFITAAGLILGSTAYNTKLLMDEYHVSEDASYKLYSAITQKQISDIQNMDQSLYRISQTTTQKMLPSNTTSNYDEAFAFNYRSISGYTSSPDDNQRDFLEHIGYTKCGENMNITNASVIGADALLSVKYTLSPYKINGLEEVSSIDNDQDKKIYRNPYALPMGLIYTDSRIKNEEADISNPFEYQNYLYSLLYGKKVSVYEPLDFSRTSEGDSKKHKAQSYSIDLKQGNYVFYGNIPWDALMDKAMLTVKNKYKTRYSWWLAPSVFYIPADQNESQATVSISSKAGYYIRPDAEQFYGLNLDTLSQVTQKISSSQPDELTIENGYVHAVCNATSDNQRLYLSVPYDKGWNVYLNGKKASYDLIDNCMYSIPLEKGENTIEMKYTCPVLYAGIAVSVFGILLTITVTLAENKKRRFKK